MTIKPRLAMIASDDCTSSFMMERKPWPHVRWFIEEYKDILDRYHILAPENTVKVLEEAVNDLQRARRTTHPLDLESRGPSHRAVIELAAAVARNEVEHVLLFQHPHNPDLERSHYRELVHTVNLHGRKLYLNMAAQLWAEYERNHRLPVIKTQPQAGTDETVVFVAHGAEKRVAHFVREHFSTIRSFPRIMADPATKNAITEVLAAEQTDTRLRIEAAGLGHGLSGVGLMIADEILRKFRELGTERIDQMSGALYHVIFFLEQQHISALGPDLQALLGICADPCLRVNLILNRQMAEEWAGRYEAAVTSVDAVPKWRTNGLRGLHP
jgi:methylglyoxal synthase